MPRTRRAGVFCSSLLFIAFSSSGLLGGAAEHATKHRFFYSDDGDSVALVYQDPFHVSHLDRRVDELVGTPVTTLCYCACTGSDLSYWPSKVCSPHDWRETSYSHGPTWLGRLYRLAGLWRQQKIDVLGTILRRAREQGIEFVPSLRMNDGHFGQQEPATKHPLTGRFWMDHRELTIVPGAEEDPDCLLDFTHTAVREYRMATIFELIDGYAAHGLELDFTRHGRFFPPGKEKPDLITDMVRSARARLAARDKADGGRRILMVRLPQSLAACRGCGLDVPQWIREGLVDYVVVGSVSRYMAFDMPLHEFVELARGTNCSIIASPDSAAPRGDGQASPEMHRAAMSNYDQMGQQGRYLFNFFCRYANRPLGVEEYALLRDLASPVTLWGTDKLYMATFESTQPGDHLPVILQGSGQSTCVPIYVGEDLARAREEHILADVQLQVRITGLEETDRVEILLNGQPLPADKATVRRPDFGEFRKLPGWVWEQGAIDGPFAWMSYPIDETWVKRGLNQVTLRLAQPRSGVERSLTVTAVDVAVHENLRGVSGR